MSTLDSIEYGRRRFQELGLGDEIFAGVVGSLMGESGRSLNPRAHNPKDPNGGAHGIFQYVGDRWEGVKELAKKTGRDPYDYRVQWDRAIEELATTEAATLGRLRKATTRHEAARIWTDGFERPNQKYANHELRAKYADEALNYLSGNGSLQGGEGNDFLTGGGGEGRDVVTAISTSNQAAGGGLNVMGQLLGLNTTPTPGEDRGPLTAGQGLAMALGALVGGPAGIKMATTLFGAGENAPPKQLSVVEGIMTGIGGLLGGIPGAALGHSLGNAIGGLFGFDSGGTGVTGGTVYPGYWESQQPSAAPSTSLVPQARPDNLNTSGGSLSGGNGGGGSTGGGLGGNGSEPGQGIW